MRTELHHLNTNPVQVLPKGGRILTIMASNTSTNPAEVEITVKPESDPESTLIKRTIPPKTTLSILAHKDDQLRLNETQNITAKCNSGSADLIVAWIGSSNTPFDSSSSSSSPSSSSSTGCTFGSTCPPPNPNGGTCQGCQCFKLVTLNCTQGSSGSECECTEGPETWVKCQDCPDPTTIPTTCESTITYCSGESSPCCGDKCNTPNSDDEMCPEGEKCCQQLNCCPKKPDGSVECCEDGTCIDENTLGACSRVDPQTGERVCTLETQEQCSFSNASASWEVCGQC